MKAIALEQNELHLLANQLQNFSNGYTVEELKVLDMVIQKIGKVLKPFIDGLKDIYSEPVPQDENTRRIYEAEIESKLQLFSKEVGEKVVGVNFENNELEFIKKTWSNMTGLKGTADVRSIVIKIDKAIEEAREPIFDK